MELKFRLNRISRIEDEDKIVLKYVLDALRVDDAELRLVVKFPGPVPKAWMSILGEYVGNVIRVSLGEDERQTSLQEGNDE